MEFDGQSKFVGARQGYEYRTAEQGTGYYKRSAPAPAEPAPRAKVSKPGGSDGPVPGMQPPLVRCAGWQQLWLSRSLSLALRPSSDAPCCACVADSCSRVPMCCAPTTRATFSS
jgi:hypothetical protein